ncbi:MAG: methionine synthase [Bacteroidales bacterium]|nr:methionine synthase [Bacteroidales bacterium]
MNFDRILIIDGAMGTMLQKHGLCGDSESFNLTHPEIIASIHQEYVDAGADIIETNTFNAGYETALAGARIARKVADAAPRKVYVAGSVGPTSKSLAMSIDVDDPSWRPTDFDSMATAYREQIRGLVEGGVDLLLIETSFDALNVKAAIYAADGFGLPIMISASASDRSGRTLTGQTLEAFYTAVKHCHPVAFGLNCSLGAAEMLPLVADISKFADCAVSCYPNAGLPNEMGGYDQAPETMAAAVREMASKGLVNIVGGCCGTTPEHIRAIAEAVYNIAPRPIVPKDKILTVSGLEAVDIDVAKNNFTNVGERTNVAGSRKFAKLIAAGEYQTGLEIAAQQIENGASVIDINMDDAMLDSTVEMEKFVRYIASDPSVSKAALMIDSSHWETILAGLKNAQGKCIVNSISLKEGEEPFLAKAREILRLGAAVVVMAFDEKGQATDFARKIEICERAYRLLTGIGFEPCDIIFDVNVLTVGTGVGTDRRYGIDFIEAVRWIKQNLPGALTSGGISNLSFAFRGNNPVREAMHSVFLYHAIAAGLDMGIVNPGMLQIYDDIEPGLRKACEDVILDSDEGAAERLLAVAAEALASKDTAVAAVQTAVDFSLPELLVKGKNEGLEAKVMAALQELGSAQAVIEGPLMEGMERVGELFGCGKMFLPQVVKSAKIMKEAVEMLQPYLDMATGAYGTRGQKYGEMAHSQSSATRPTVVIATVKGDVHDIGKNITATVLQCNGFRVVDLGVMVENEVILAAAERENAEIVAVSGLITPSLGQMEELCTMMAAKGMTKPLLIGGATTSALHTAVKLAPLYDHVFYGPDASASAVLAKRYMLDAAKFETEEHAKQAEIRSLHEQKKSAPKCAQTIFDVLSPDGYLPLELLKDQALTVQEAPLEEVAEHIDWNTFYAIWRIKPESIDSEEVKAIKAEAENLLKKMKCHIMVGTNFIKDGVGCFAAAVHADNWRNLHFYGCSCPACLDNTYKAVDEAAKEGLTLETSLRLCLADAASSWMSSKISVPEGYRLIMPGIGYASCPDHRLKQEVIDSIPNGRGLGIRLTESFAMTPDASVCGYIIVHKDARYL